MILVLDNYDSFTYNLVHLLGRYHADVVVHRNDVLSCDAVEAMAPEGILISPGPGRPRDAGICEEVIARLGPTIPILGICLGHQAIAQAHGGVVTYAPELMHGKTSTIHHDGRTIFAKVNQDFTATRYHSLIVERASIPDSLHICAETDDAIVMGLRHGTWPTEGVQFHPESVLTYEGPRIIANWVSRVARWQTSKGRSA